MTDTMTDTRAAEVLAAHNEWRRYDGETGEPGAPAMGDPTELGRAIDHVVSRLRAQPPAEAQAVAWPEGLLDRVKEAERRMEAGYAPRRIPANASDVDLLLAEIRALLEGHNPPFWLKPLTLDPPSAPVGVEEQPVAWTDADMEKPCGAEVAFLRRLSEAHWVPAEVGGMLRHSARLLEHRATALRSIYDLLNVETEADAGAEIARLHTIAQQPAADHSEQPLDMVEQPAAVDEAKALAEKCRKAFSEELAAYDIDPPIAHVKEAHDACVEFLDAQQQGGDK